MPTEKIHTARHRGPVTLKVRLVDQELGIRVQECDRAELGVATADESGTSADLVRAAQFVERDGYIELELGHAGSGSFQVNSFGGGRGINVAQVGGRVYSSRGGIFVNGDFIGGGNGGSYLLGGSPVLVAALLPRGSRIEAETLSGDVRVVGLPATSSVRSTSGDIRLDEAAEANLRTVSGDITVGALRGDGSFESTSGDIRVAATGKSYVQAHSVSGDVTVSGPARVQARSVSGRVRTDH